MPIPSNKQSAIITDAALSVNTLEKILVGTDTARDTVEIAEGVKALVRFIHQHFGDAAFADVASITAPITASITALETRTNSAVRGLRSTASTTTTKLRSLERSINGLSSRLSTVSDRAEAINRHFRSEVSRLDRSVSDARNHVPQHWHSTPSNASGYSQIVRMGRGPYSHFEPTCVPGYTEVLMADGGWKPIAEITVGETVQGRTRPNKVLAYDRVRLGNHRNPNLYSINGDYANTDDHLTLLDRGWAVLDHDAYLAYHGQALSCVYLGDMTQVQMVFEGIRPANVTEYAVGDKIAFGARQFRRIESIEVIESDPDETVYSLVCDGDGTMQVAGGYVLSAWVSDAKWAARAGV